MYKIMLMSKEFSIKKFHIANSCRKLILKFLILFACCLSLICVLTCSSCDFFDPGEDGTWTIYLYMCGSNLESGNNNALTPDSQNLVDKQALDYNKDLYQQKYNWAQKYNKLVANNSKTLPDFCTENLYNPNRIDWNKTMKNSQQTEAGDTYSNASRVLDEICMVKLPENVRFVVQTGGSKYWRNPNINPNVSQRFVIDCNGMRQISSDAMKNMADGATFSDFLNFGKTNYPADHNICILWNHGLGINGCCSDELYGNDLLTLDEMQQAFLENFPNMDQIRPFDILYFDCCLMGSLDVAYKLRNTANYMVASKENIFEISGYYEEWVDTLAHNTKILSKELAKKICDAYLERSKKNGNRKNTMSAVDLGKIDTLKQTYEELALKLLVDGCQDNSVFNQIKTHMSDIFKFGGEQKNMVNMIDLKTFTTLMPDAYESYCDKVENAIDDCIVYSKSLGEVVSDSPLSFYFPCGISDQEAYLYALNYLENVETGHASSCLATYYIFGCLTAAQKEYVKNACDVDVPKTNLYFAF